MKRDAKFLKLQKQWYSKLADDGFNDIEWTRSQKSFDQNSPYLHGFRERQDRPTFEHTQNWYLLVQNYRTHATVLPNSREFIPKIHKIILDLYLEGVPYRKIADKINKTYTTRLALRTRKLRKAPKVKHMSLTKVFWILQKHLPYIVEWNRTHPEGRLFGTHDDFYAEEVLLNESKHPAGNA